MEEEIKSQKLHCSVYRAVTIRKQDGLLLSLKFKDKEIDKTVRLNEQIKSKELKCCKTQQLL